ncbi:hypothetical protein CBL_09328 [Carabus blaptoides fortunei]
MGLGSGYVREPVTVHDETEVYHSHRATKLPCHAAYATTRHMPPNLPQFYNSTFSDVSRCARDSSRAFRSSLRSGPYKQRTTVAVICLAFHVATTRQGQKQYRRPPTAVDQPTTISLAHLLVFLTTGQRSTSKRVSSVRAVAGFAPYM